MDHDDCEEDAVLALPARLETSSFFSPVIVVMPQIAVAVNGVDFAGGQVASAMNALQGALSFA
ncbi:MAG TPA: hypothetical protein VF155_08280 [Candidatus Dormibacteraeota bacterium]